MAIRKEVTDARAKLMYKVTTDVYTDKYGKPDDVVDMIINDIARIEQYKSEYDEQIKKDGTMMEWQNSAVQKGKREHPLLKERPRLIEQQRKLFAELNLTPATIKISKTEKASDEFDDF